MDRHIKAPLDREEVKTLEAGDYVYITGTVYTARDAAHLRMDQALDRGEKLPIELEGNVIYYMGPTPAREGRPIGSAGPTTAKRSNGCNRKKWCGIFCRSWRCRSSAFKMY